MRKQEKEDFRKPEEEQKEHIISEILPPPTNIERRDINLQEDTLTHETKIRQKSNTPSTDKKVRRYYEKYTSESTIPTQHGNRIHTNQQVPTFEEDRRNNRPPDKSNREGSVEEDKEANLILKGILHLLGTTPDPDKRVKTLVKKIHRAWCLRNGRGRAKGHYLVG